MLIHRRMLSEIADSALSDDCIPAVYVFLRLKPEIQSGNFGSGEQRRKTQEVKGDDAPSDLAQTGQNRKNEQSRNEGQRFS